jgi:signal transduction histidine kinase
MEILLGLILIFSTIHCINFAIFRMQEGAQFWGWTSTFFLAQGLAIIFPSYSIEFLARTEKNRLENLVEIRTQEKSNLLRIILHDLITPLNCIWDYVEGWKSKEVEEGRAFTKINTFMGEIQQIIKEVREIETNKVGKKNLPMEPVIIHESLKESLEKLQKEIKEKNIKINFPELNNDPLYIRGNNSLLENSIFGNILKNAIKFSNLGGSISIEVEENLNSIKIHIKDEGIGIPKYLMENLFIHGATTSRKGTMGEIGSGLGLLILKEAIIMLKGNLCIKSKSIEENKTNHGTIVSLTFPKIKNNNGGKNAFNNS